LLEERANTIDMRTMWVKKRLRLEALNEEALVRSIGTFEQALRVRSGAIVRLERSRAASKRQIAITHELPIEHN
jgi:hypothetical protein